MSDQARVKSLTILVVTFGLLVPAGAVTSVLNSRSQEKLIRSLYQGIEKRDDLIAAQKALITALQRPAR